MAATRSNVHMVYYKRNYRLWIKHFCMAEVRNFEVMFWNVTGALSCSCCWPGYVD
jgi:hypothetical protein